MNRMLHQAAVAAVAAVPDASPAEGATAEGTALPAGGRLSVEGMGFPAYPKDL